jgi:hypothetical protein
MSGWLRFYAEVGDGKINLTNNYYGTSSELLVNKHAIDFNNFQILKDFELTPFLTEPNENMYPFVYDVKYFDHNNVESNTLSTGDMTFKLYFNRDMDISRQPLVFFGPEYPFTDYVIAGDWESERVWVGKYKVSPLTGDGVNFMRIRDAYAKDNAWLRTGDDDGRFWFHIATFSAESINLSAESLDGGIKLTWNQDEYETMLGYNIYRSTTLNGTYSRVNFTVIHHSENEYTDFNVEPGKEYYYKYAILTTDLNESSFSDIVIGASLDTLLPVVSHIPIVEAIENKNVLVSFTAVDNIGVIGAKLFFKKPNEATYKSLDMFKSTNDRYFASISSSMFNITGLEYYFEVYDARNTFSFGSALSPISVKVKPEVQDIQYGDVNGDGFITVVDVLLILQAINEIIVFDEQQFKRADINEDGILSALEALMILQYLTGSRSVLKD